MEQPIKILIVEDNVIIADDMQSMLEEIGYEIVDNVIVYEQAIEVLKTKQVDLVLIDIILASDKTGIDLGKHIREKYNIPFIFVTSNSDRATVENAKTVKPNGYLVKPFEQQDLYTSIEIALSSFNYNEKAAGTTSAPTEEVTDDKLVSNSVLKDSIFVKKQHLYYRIQFGDIQFIKADNVYLEVNTVDKKFLVRSPLKDYLEKLPSNKFYRAHKSYIVNVDHIEAINSKDILINNNLIPISKEFKEFIISAMNS
ncbi:MULTISPECIES: LytR/AlgR family response regulator transcription factor [Cellulophaga]|uniref:LytTR family transcriptional regulator n=1 Tax=Cellulophaga baltica 18 TaxID=1348584 RepID=A0AAU8RJE5_9FLAO|nr:MULTISPECIES: response regulator [Cellulophaga]WFO17023.1 response regulator [Cellulophaga baltica 4]AIY14187.1 LytTR family transcriptional regulator [Cellulophaga baltica NN016038]AIZ42538.1 LytTR family transcriptional regulator [Cellulophaga baltica 18]KGK29655.1 LytTR family transcriptional regulator [Cellulophaga sp. E6(2014)]MBA6315873.1 response regulator transcription factor [Cellulophaga baltica]